MDLNTQEPKVTKSDYGDLQPMIIIGILLFITPFISAVFGVIIEGFLRNMFMLLGVLSIFLGILIKIFTEV